MGDYNTHYYIIMVRFNIKKCQINFSLVIEYNNIMFVVVMFKKKYYTTSHHIYI